MSHPALEARDRDSLCRAMVQGGRVKFVFFWNHQETRDGSASSACLSHWYDAPFSIDGVSYPTAEHYLMAEKARLFGDLSARERILESVEPGAAKKIGREVRGFDEPTWIEHRFGIAVAGNVAKFSQHPTLNSYLINTGKRVLVEASPLDRIWGVGLESEDPRAEDPTQWKGLNLLGFVLMQARSLIAAV